ncbi:MAG TPA: linear amide C-N hydrolase [Candidatus Binatia bacterium]|nr:linear amide C-N hydrolase [Candidatus Binatia bacterium]
MKHVILSMFVLLLPLGQRAVPCTSFRVVTKDGAALVAHLPLKPPTGSAPARAGGLDYDLTQWATVSDLTNKIYYFRTYKNLTIRKIDLKKLGFGGTTIRHMNIDGDEQFVDVANQVK